MEKQAVRDRACARVCVFYMIDPAVWRIALHPTLNQACRDL